MKINKCFRSMAGSHDSSSPRAPTGERIALACVTAALMSLAACGGGGGGTPAPAPVEETPPPPPPAVVVNPLPTGTGIVTFTQGSAGGEFVVVNPTTGALTKLSTPCDTNEAGFTSADLDPDGIVIGAATDLYKVDMVSGVCVKLADAPVVIEQLAVAPSGKIYTFSRHSLDLHILSADGKTVESTLAVTGTSELKGLDFGPDGSLYLLAYLDGSSTDIGVFKVDLTTGVATQQYLATNVAGDIDIDGSNVLRVAGLNAMNTINNANGAVIGTVAPGGTTGGPLVYR